MASYHHSSSPSYASYTPSKTTTPPADMTEIIPPPPITDGENGIASTSKLTSRLATLRTQSSELSNELTKKLATSRSGQSLLHIGPSLSTLPPDLSTLIDALDPLLAEVSEYERENWSELQRLVSLGGAVRKALWRSQFGVECREIYGDLCGAEKVLLADGGGGDGSEEGKDGDCVAGDYELDRVNSLERCAYTALFLLQELQSSSSQVSAMTGSAAALTANDGNEAPTNNNNTLSTLLSANDSDINGVIIEKSRFLMKLSPRIRKLESDTTKALLRTLEELLTSIRNNAMEQHNENDPKKRDTITTDNLLLMVGSCLRGLALLGKGAEAESAFARVAIMPIIRSKISMGKLDEGGSRGECAGLFFLLDDIANTIATMYGALLRSSEGMFTHDDVAVSNCRVSMEVDLVVSGVWIPIATALMADPGIRTAIFSPGIANILQANYSALDTFLSELAGNLLKAPQQDHSEEKTDLESDFGDFSHLYYQPKITANSIERAQSRLYSHPTTIDFSKKWNLPIYYQLRFAEFCKRLDKALEQVRNEGWEADVYTGEENNNKMIRDQLGFELPIFIELYDVLASMWRSNVFLRPLTHRFLRGAVQLIGRVLAFIKDGLDGNIEFGGNTNEVAATTTETLDDKEGEPAETVAGIPAYLWNSRIEDLAVVSWELTILETCMTHDYLDVVAKTVCPVDAESRKNTHNANTELEEIKSISADVLLESSQEISPLIDSSWNKLIVDNLITECCVPLSAVKGVAATYRMTNRPPPTQASPFVATILRPLKEFDNSYSSRTPPQIGEEWKYSVIGTVADRYSIAVEELIATVKRTEEALKSRKTRRMMAGGMSDGEKVKLQLFLDHKEFKSHVEELGVDSERVAGLLKLKELTEEAQAYEQTQAS